MIGLVKFDESARYKIVVKGELPQSLSEMFDISEIKKVKRKNMLKTVILVMTKDQAHLIGIMNLLYDWHYPILKVDCLGKLPNPLLLCFLSLSII